jgi:TonB family protein
VKFIPFLNAGLHIAILAALPVSVSAAAAQSLPLLAPSSPWKIDYADNECRLLRNFGSGDAAVTMRLARGSGFDSFDMVIAGASVPKLPQQLDLIMGLEPQGKSQTVEAYSLGLPKRTERFIRWYDAKPDLLPSITNDQIVTVRHTEKYAVSMHWTDGKAALEALQTCHDDLLKSWGVDIAAVKGAKVRAAPIGSPGRWATSSDYPDAAQRAEKEGTVVFQVEIAPDASIIKCIVIKSSLVAELDEASCRLVKQRAKFSPALDQNDQPILGFYVNRIRWQIPR